MSDFTISWGKRVRAQRARMGLQQQQLAERVGVSPRSIWQIEKGMRLCDYRIAMRLCEVLGMESLRDEMIEHRSRVCDVCGRRFVNVTNNPSKRSCTRECRNIDNARKARAFAVSYRSRVVARAKGREQMLRSRYTVYVAAVEAFCRSCEPEGLCRAGSCELRTVSPLPLSERRSA